MAAKMKAFYFDSIKDKQRVNINRDCFMKYVKSMKKKVFLSRKSLNCFEVDRDKGTGKSKDLLPPRKSLEIRKNGKILSHFSF